MYSDFVAIPPPCADFSYALAEFGEPMPGPLEPADAISGVFDPVDPSAIPQPFHGLLVHERHMTPTLTTFYGQAPRLRVLKSVRVGCTYVRRVELLVDGRPGQAERVIQHATLRVDLSLLPHELASEVCLERVPFGTILQQLRLRTVVRPERFLRFTRSRLCGPLPESSEPVNPQAWYGRIGSIDCDGRPGIRMFELLTGA